MQILVNDLQHDVPAGTTVAKVLQSLNIESRYVAVEVNCELVPRQMHDQHELSEGDQLEVVTLVGGG